MRQLMGMASFLADNIGNITSQKRIASGLLASGAPASPAMVGEHLDALEENFLFFKAIRYDLKGRGYLAMLEKYYLGDLGFRY